MFRCSVCTAAFTDYFKPRTNCSQCNSVLEQICLFCRRESLDGELAMTCFRCRPHMCLSKCSGGCIKKKNIQAPNCKCHGGKSPQRFKVNKEGKNRDKWFWTCKSCNFFAWDV